MSASVRARRPASPPPGTSYPPPPYPSNHNSSQRFPTPREGILDADERRAQASLGFGPTSARKGGGHQFPSGGLKVTSGEWKLLAVVLAIACAVRLFRIGWPDSVVFDEVHFGKFAGKYIKTRYFVDVHPPLAKLLITLAAFVFGFDGDFDFKDIAKVYENTPYVAMRMVPAILGIATVPLAYLTLRALDCRATTALLASMLITFENGLITQSRHILLDSPLIFFTALTTFVWTGFCNEDKHEPFTKRWWTWLTLSGLSLGAVVSCKWVGLFTIATIGMSTLRQLWILLGDVRVSPRLWFRHFWARAICLILLPVLFYMTMFQIHFLILENSGDGDGFMSAEFQHTLGGHQMEDTYADVAIGSTVSIRHVNTQGGYLHSHAHNYPGGSMQQQITLYPHGDENNDWRILNGTEQGNPLDDWESLNPLRFITNGQRLKFRHLTTEKNLHSHDFRPPVSEVEFQNEVSAYGMPGFVGDSNDDWIIELDGGAKTLKTLRTKFRLRHVLTGCYLFSHKVKLPQWGYEQQEVTCNKNAVKANSLWMIETSDHPYMPTNAKKVNYRQMGFLAKFWELQQVMWTTNAGLTERHTFDSRPDSWPSLRRGINFWVKDHRQVYLLGNPMVWWLSTAAVLAYTSVRGFLILRQKRGYRDFENTKVVKYDSLCGFLFLGWALHYLPFYLMSRQLFLHHYFPALYFAILLLCSVFDFLTSTLRPRLRLQIAVFLVVLAVWNYWIFSPLVYGGQWTKGKCLEAKWVKTWDFSCGDFYDTYAEYEGTIAATPHESKVAVSPPVPVATVGGEAGGRGAVVVDVKDNEAAAPVVEETPVPEGARPEPGRDIFAGDEKNNLGNLKSLAAQAQAQREQKLRDKQVSTVGQGGGQVQGSGGGDNAEMDTVTPRNEEEMLKAKMAEKEAAKVNPNIPKSEPAVEPELGQVVIEEQSLPSARTESLDTPLAEESTSTAAEVASTTATQEEPIKADRPLGEEEAEADEVRQELFPEAGEP